MTRMFVMYRYPNMSRWWFQLFFIFNPENWGRWTQFDSYFSKGLVQPPTRCPYLEGVTFAKPSCLVPSLKLTSPVQIGHPKRKLTSLPTVHFQRLCGYVSFRECIHIGFQGSVVTSKNNTSKVDNTRWGSGLIECDWVVVSSIICVIFPTKIGEDEPILTSIFFQMGWNSTTNADDLPYQNACVVWMKASALEKFECLGCLGMKRPNLFGPLARKKPHEFVPTFEGKKEKNRFGVCLAEFLFWRHDFFVMDIFCVYIYIIYILHVSNTLGIHRHILRWFWQKSGVRSLTYKNA